MTDVSKNTLSRLIEKVVEDNIQPNPFMINEEVRQPFKLEMPSDLVRLAQIFYNDGHELYVVGGAVRDALLGKTPKDYDVATNAQPDTVVEMLSKFPEYNILEVGKAFGIVNVITPEGNEYEVATFREETYLKDDYESFIKFIQEKQPENWKERLHILARMSND